MDRAQQTEQIEQLVIELGAQGLLLRVAEVYRQMSGLTVASFSRDWAAASDKVTAVARTISDKLEV